MNIRNLYRREYTPSDSQEGELNTKIQRAATSWSDEYPDRKEITWQIAQTCRYAMWLAVETDKEDWECLSRAIEDNHQDPTETILAIMGLKIEPVTGPISERTCDAGTWIIVLRDGRKIPFYQGVSDKNPLSGEYAIPTFDKGTHWEIQADKKFSLYSSLGEDGKSNGKSIIAKRDVANVYFERYDSEITPTDRMDPEHINQILETATLEEGEASEVVRLAKELVESTTRT
jgi:hypothetical protein